MNKMESMPVKKLVMTMSLPIAISMLMSALYNIVDGMFVAGYSQKALLAVSLCYPVQTFMIAVACGTGVGFNTILARRLGEKNQDAANQSIMMGLALAMVNWLIFFFCGWVFGRSFLSLFTKDAEVIRQGLIYIKIVTLCSFGIFVQITYERIMQATGRPMYNMYIQCLGAIINIILDPILIFGMFGLPEMGIAGAAIATVTGMIVAMITGIIIGNKYVPEIKIDFRKFRFDPVLLKNIYEVGFPAIIMQSVMSFMSVLMNWILVPYSEVAINVFGIYIKLQQFVFMAVMGITNAIIPIIAFNYGARKMNRIGETVRFSLLLSALIMGAGMIVFLLFPSQLLSMFSADEAMYKLGIPCLRTISLSFIFAGISMILGSSFQALNHPIVSLFITLLRQLIILLPLTSILAHFFGLNTGWFAFVITEVLCSILSLGEWKKIKQDLHIQNV